MDRFKIESIVFCEAVRPEIDGKHTLLGAFAPELNIGQVPSVIQLAIWVAGTPTSLGSFSAEFRAMNPHGRKLIGGQLNGDFLVAAKTSMVLGAFPLEIDGPGEYSFDWNFDNTGWTPLGKLVVHFAPQTTVGHSSGT